MRWSVKAFTSAFTVTATVLVAVVAARAVDQTPPSRAGGSQPAAAAPDPVARGRFLIVSHACGLCHGGGDDPAAKGWLTGAAGPETEFKIGPPPCGADPKATGCFTTRPR